ncbi:MAG: hypothetical protein IKS48_00185 [Eubacterium sp.]|nr:hypothetical protein [Eubacterium sp.]
METVVTEMHTLDEFYEDWSLTFTGVIKDEIPLYLDFLDEHGGLKNRDYYTFTGKLMNDYYCLTGSNRYADDLNFLVIRLSSLKNIAETSVARFGLGGRWFTDIVDNNSSRQNIELMVYGRESL